MRFELVERISGEAVILLYDGHYKYNDSWDSISLDLEDLLNLKAKIPQLINQVKVKNKELVIQKLERNKYLDELLEETKKKREEKIRELR